MGITTRTRNGGDVRLTEIMMKTEYKRLPEGRDKACAVEERSVWGFVSRNAKKSRGKAYQDECDEVEHPGEIRIRCDRERLSGLKPCG